MSTRCFHPTRAAALRLALAGVWLAGALVWAQTSPFKPYQLRALYLFNFAKFTQWPESVFGATNAPLVLGILGRDDFGRENVKMIVGKQLKGRAVEVRPVGSVEEGAGCHLLFISDSERNRLREIVRALENAPVLTVAERPDFIELGGMINLAWKPKDRGGEELNLVFEINLVAAEAAGLKLDSRLLRLAERVTTREGQRRKTKEGEND